jgi:two-component system chemotaxis response regulator CheB
VRRYRCRIGHAWTAAGLLSQQTAALEQALWTALRSLEEKSSLSRKLLADASGRRHQSLVGRYENAAEEAERAAEEIRRFLLAGLPLRDPTAEGTP